MIIDAHQHFWDLKVFDQDWTSGPIRRTFLPKHLAPLLRKAGVDRSIVVQTKHDLRENDWALGLEAPFVAGVVGWIDLASADVERQLLDFRRHPKAVGVRHIVQDEPDDDWVVRPDVLRGLRVLARHGVPFDLLTYVRQLHHAVTIARKIPGLRIVIDHLSKPRVKEGKILGWIDDLRAAAAFPNVHCKLSSLVTQADWTRWSAAELRPYVNVALDLFGPERLMFGSDWPVCLLASSYQDWIDALRDLLSPLSAPERARIFGGTAKAFYRLKGV
jgi:L-fuconolactonase